MDEKAAWTTFAAALLGRSPATATATAAELADAMMVEWKKRFAPASGPQSLQFTATQEKIEIRRRDMTGPTGLIFSGHVTPGTECEIRFEPQAVDAAAPGGRIAAHGCTECGSYSCIGPTCRGKRVDTPVPGE